MPTHEENYPTLSTPLAARQAVSAQPEASPPLIRPVLDVIVEIRLSVPNTATYKLEDRMHESLKERFQSAQSHATGLVG